MSWRATIRAQLKQKLQDYVDANPTILRAAYPARPGSFTETPCAYVGDITLDIRHDQGTKQTSGTVELVFVTADIDNAEAKAGLDAAVDAVEDALTDDPHVIQGNTVCEPVGSAPIALDVGAVAYTGTVLTVGNIVIQEGRT